MQGKIALEEHFAIPDTLMDSAGFVPDSYWPELKDRLLDIQDKRLAQMDRHGVEMMILSLNAPAVQAIPDVARANEIAIRANDFLAEQVAKRPSRFQAFAALPMQDPDLATIELERCIKTLGFRGALVNGFSQIGDGKRPVYYSVKANRVMRIRLDRDLDSERESVGNKFSATLVDPLFGKGGVILAPQGSRVGGRVTNVRRADKKGQPAVLDVEFVSLRLPNGARIPSTVRSSTSQPLARRATTKGKSRLTRPVIAN